MQERLGGEKNEEKGGRKEKKGGSMRKVAGVNKMWQDDREREAKRETEGGKKWKRGKG